MRLQSCAVNHVNRCLEKTGDVVFEAHVIVDRPFGPRSAPVPRFAAGLLVVTALLVTAGLRPPLAKSDVPLRTVAETVGPIDVRLFARERSAQRVLRALR